MEKELPTDTTLQLLKEIEEDQNPSQRSLSIRLGIAVGLTNAYIRKCVRKGWIKMSKAPMRRYAYYLTPRGFAEKGRLTAKYLENSFLFFREARGQCLEVFRSCERRGWKRVVLYGISELAEISILAARETRIEPIAIIEPESTRREFAGLPVHAGIGDVDQVDAVLITDIAKPQAVYDELRNTRLEESILAPSLLNISRNDKKFHLAPDIPE